MTSKEYIYEIVEKDNLGNLLPYELNNLVYHEFGGGVYAIQYFPESIGGKYNLLKRSHPKNIEALQNPSL